MNNRETSENDGKDASKGEIIVYQSNDGRVKLDVRLEGELDTTSTVKEFLTVRLEGRRQVKRSLNHCNLYMIISVGYRMGLTNWKGDETTRLFLAGKKGGLQND